MIVKLKPIIIPLIVISAAAILIYLLIPGYHPFGGLKVANNKESILKQSKEYLEKVNLSFDDDKLEIGFEADKNFIRWINSEYKINESNKILSDAGSAYYWTVSQSKEDKSDIVVSSNSDGNIELKNPVSN